MENLPDPSSLPPTVQVWGSIISFVAITIFALIKYLRPPAPATQEPNDMLLQGVSIADARPWRSMALSLERIAESTATIVELQQTIAYEADMQRRLKIELAAARERGEGNPRGPIPRARPRSAWPG